jgi:hypothetical protein
MEYIEKYIPYHVQKGSYDEFKIFYSAFSLSYFIGRYLLNKCLHKNYFIHEESTSRIFSSLSQILICIYLFVYGPCWGTHAFMAYVINDMAYSLVFKPYLEEMIYYHHTVGVLISMVGLHVLEYFDSNSIHYQNCFKVTAALLAMEMSAPLLSLLWISKREPNFNWIKLNIVPVIKPLLYVSYVVFRLVVPEMTFFMIQNHPWNNFFVGYTLVQTFLLMLITMQIYWFIKLLK